VLTNFPLFRDSKERLGLDDVCSVVVQGHAASSRSWLDGIDVEEEQLVLQWTVPLLGGKKKRKNGKKAKTGVVGKHEKKKKVATTNKGKRGKKDKRGRQAKTTTGVGGNKKATFREAARKGQPKKLATKASICGSKRPHDGSHDDEPAAKRTHMDVDSDSEEE